MRGASPSTKAATAGRGRSLDERVRLYSENWPSTLRSKGGKVICDPTGHSLKPRKHLGGVVVNRFKNLNEAVALWRRIRHLATVSSIEIRPIDEENERPLGSQEKSPGPVHRNEKAVRKF